MQECEEETKIDTFQKIFHPNTCTLPFTTYSKFTGGLFPRQLYGLPGGMRKKPAIVKPKATNTTAITSMLDNEISKIKKEAETKKKTKAEPKKEEKKEEKQKQKQEDAHTTDKPKQDATANKTEMPTSPNKTSASKENVKLKSKENEDRKDESKKETQNNKEKENEIEKTTQIENESKKEEEIPKETQASILKPLNQIAEENKSNTATDLVSNFPPIIGKNKNKIEIEIETDTNTIEESKKEEIVPIKDIKQKAEEEQTAATTKTKEADQPMDDITQINTAAHIDQVKNDSEREVKHIEISGKVLIIAEYHEEHGERNDKIENKLDIKGIVDTKQEHRTQDEAPINIKEGRIINNDSKANQNNILPTQKKQKIPIIEEVEEPNENENEKNTQEIDSGTHKFTNTLNMQETLEDIEQSYQTEKFESDSEKNTPQKQNDTNAHQTPDSNNDGMFIIRSK